jgi:hydroxyethylthiazole kinase
VLERLRSRTPRVHCITNAVAQNFTANILLAAGATPSMTISPEEIGAFVASADALLVNLGTFDDERRKAVKIAVEAATRGDVPWVLDPVLIDRAPPRAAFAKELVALKPAAVRLNQAEFAALGGALKNTVVALSGEADRVSDNARTATISNGHALMAKVTAMGCAASALTAACLAVERDPWRAAVSALLMLNIAGEQAAGAGKGPGSFAVAIIDELHRLDRTAILERAKVTS